MFNLKDFYKYRYVRAACLAAAFVIVSAAAAVATTVTKDDSYATVLAPEQFGGEAAMGYAAAGAVPKICAKLFCYCGCDSTENHTSLLDCFTSTHGNDCHICQEEALMALRMQKEGKSLKEIQKSIDDTYSHMYPFRNPTQALKYYRARKLYVGNVQGLDDTQHGADVLRAMGMQGIGMATQGPILGKSSCCSGHSN